MRRAKIVCTIGPASESETALAALIEAGMDVARLNMSHGDHAGHGAVIERVRRISASLGRRVGILLDLAGPKIRLGELARPVELTKGQEVRLTVADVVGEGNVLPVRYPLLVKESDPGERLSINDGLVHLEVMSASGEEVRARVVAGGVVSSRKGVNLPDGGEGIPALTAKDEADLEFGLLAGVDWVSLSFVRTPADADGPRAVMERVGRRVPLMAKIEKRQAVENLAGIVEAFDGLMVARGDLGVEVEITDLPRLQKAIISAANRAGKPVVTATQMLLSMVGNPRPTRAEVTDVANAVLDGADAVMLSEETAMGQYAPQAVATMAALADRATLIPAAHPAALCEEAPLYTPPAAIARATKTIADEIGARVIITPTTSGSTPMLIAASRPDQPILAVGSDEEVLRQLTIVWGVATVLAPEATSTDALFAACRKAALDSGLAEKGARAVVTAGVPIGRSGSTNMLKIMEV